MIAIWGFFVIAFSPVLAGDTAPSGGRFEERALKAEGIDTVRAVWHHDEGGGGISGQQCPPTIATYTDANFQGGSFVAQAGFAQGEVAACSYTLAASAFPIQINLSEMIFATSGASQQTTTEWSILFWDGTPQTGTLVAQFSSDDLILPHLRLGPGTAGANLQFSVDPGDPDQIYINDDNGTHTFSVGYRIDHHNQPPANPCTQSPPTCCNAFPTTDTSGLSNASNNWLNGLNCGPFGCPPNGGWARFANLAQFCRPSGDWVMRTTWTSVNCTPVVGACCLPNGSCVVQSNSNCSAQGGVYRGDNVTCGNANCQPITGACCLPNGSCTVITSTDCSAQGGTYRGNDVTCANANCPSPTGGCCFQATGGCVNLNQTDCANAGGVFHVGQTCGSFVCFPIGACCLPNGTCLASVSPETCSAQGGTFRGNGTNCQSPCPQPTGACCLPNGFCLNLTQTDCGSTGGTWRGFGTQCDQGGPAITVQPQPQSVCGGAQASFSVGVCGTGTITYQWLRANNPINGATSQTYTIQSAALGDVADYSVSVTNAGGTRTSDSAHLAVTRRCDSNCDGLVNNFDIDAFVIALTQGQSGWSQQYHCLFLCANDANQNGTVNNFDIDAFVQCLTGG